MSRRVVVHSVEFVTAIRENLLHLVRSDRLEWVALMEADLDELEVLVASFPQAGKLIESRGQRQLRRASFKRTPFVVWYAVESAPSAAPIVFLRLYHLRQRTPRRPLW